MRLCSCAMGAANRAGSDIPASGPAAFPRGGFLACPGPLDLRVAPCCREDGSIFCLGSPRRPTSTSLARFPRRPEHGTARARLLARAPSSKSRRAFVGVASVASGGNRHSLNTRARATRRIYRAAGLWRPAPWVLRGPRCGRSLRRRKGRVGVEEGRGGGGMEGRRRGGEGGSGGG